MRVFLSGGTRGDWQDRVIAKCPGAEYWDPRTLRDNDMTRIATTERQWLDETDVLFVCIEADNPSGLGSAFEMGYAIARSKPVLFVDEKRTRHTEWLGVHCLRTVPSLQEGIALLREMIAASPSEAGRRREQATRGHRMESVKASINAGDLSALDSRLSEIAAAALGRLIADDRSVYEPLLLGISSHSVRAYDWNIGYLIPHLRPEWLAQLLVKSGPVLYPSEGVAWGLGELGSHDERIIDFLYAQCEAMMSEDAWWCASVALEKLKSVNDHVDLLKRTMTDPQWESLDACLGNIGRRAAVISLLKLVNRSNLETVVIPGLVAALDSKDHHVVQNALWLLERLRFSRNGVLDKLHELHTSSEDAGHTIQPRVVEALGAIGDRRSRGLLEAAVGTAKYFRTRAYAARGLGLIGNTASLPVLESALSAEKDERVVPYITEAMYAIRDDGKRELNKIRRDAGWPENGMIADHTNAWYANPHVYELFSRAEDPEAVALDRAVGLLPSHCRRILDVGTGTGRLALHLARKLEGVTIEAVDVQPEMVEWLGNRIAKDRLESSVSERCADMSSLPYEDSSFDAVVSSWGFPSTMWDPDACLAQVGEVHRVLRPEGVLITVGWDESFQDELSEMWYRYVPEPAYYRETVEDWRRRRIRRIHSPRNCYLAFAQRHIRVPLRFSTVQESAYVMGHLFGFAAGEAVARDGKREFAMDVGITYDTHEDVAAAIVKLQMQKATHSNRPTS